ncbi:MAG: DUF1501 domain-containing protein, partial [Planctomycetota bacterium]
VEQGRAQLLQRLNEQHLADRPGNLELEARIASFELAGRMQLAALDALDLSQETAETQRAYGLENPATKSYGKRCLMARRLVERGVRFVQLFHRGWDQHTNLPKQITGQCLDTDQPSAALIRDLKQRGLLDDTLVIWGGEFGRTVYCQGQLTAENYGRDHHPRCFTIWLAGGGVRPGMTWGETDDFSYNVTRDPVHIHDLHATLLHCLGIDHTRLTFRYQGRDFRLTDVHGQVIRDILL